MCWRVCGLGQEGCPCPDDEGGGAGEGGVVEKLEG